MNTINPLANPKGVKLVCELCQKPAFVQCTDCRVTYYCGPEHQRADWLGIHEKICQLLMALRSPIPFLGSEDERQHRKQQQIIRQKQMIDLCRTEGQKLLFEGKYDRAVPAALQSLKFSIDIYGLSSIELVPSYLILGEASIGLGKLSQAEEYLAQAEWTALKTPGCDNAIKSRLYRNLGLLNAAKGNFSDALTLLADDIYHSSLQHGTDDIHTSGGYFHMANVFNRQNKLDVAFSLYNQVTDIWYEHLSKLVGQRTQTPAKPSGIGPAFNSGIPTGFDVLDEAQEAEAIQVIHAILELREQQSMQTPSVMCKIYFTVAMLQFVLGNMQKARDFGIKARTSCENVVSGDEENMKKIVEFLVAVERML
ncbi:zinc finger MYND domain-containing protein 12 [Nematostella vectensis]|uniref:zinc finger MYND domain-containing protein 12 n=1 Tax=Nematostella vectensis TaxID=45351 RepID=UPI00207726A4|nr:zinc finger MYND domain-containing protein 12 [Nematostella vectensis]